MGEADAYGKRPQNEFEMTLQDWVLKDRRETAQVSVEDLKNCLIIDVKVALPVSVGTS